jgi:hypothetical protein
MSRSSDKVYDGRNLEVKVTRLYVAKVVRMNILSCPTSLVNAPMDVVWKLLTEPAGWTEFWNFRVTSIDPPGPAAVGQRIYAEAGPQILHLVVTLEFTDIDVAKRTIGLIVEFPLGITVRENLSCSVVSSSQCRVSYHCSFDLPDGWRGAITRTVLHRRFKTGPKDSLSRLTRAAESKVSPVRNTKQD